jgi:6-phosphogluconolactonase
VSARPPTGTSIVGVVDLAATLALVRSHATEALGRRGRFDLVVPGGRGPRPLFAALRDGGDVGADWRIHLSDERCVPHSDPRRNGPAIAAALGLTPDDDRLVAPPWSGAHDADAQAYAQRVAAVEVFDLVVLGLGADGHTASLFPDDPTGLAPDAPDAVAVHVADADPAERITLSASRLRRSRTIVFVVTGEDKDLALSRVSDGTDGAFPTAALAGPACWIADLRDGTAGITRR